MMEFCPNCGATIQASDQNFCPNCGYPLSTKARKMVMGVTQKMLLVAPQAENNKQPTPPATDEHGILNERYEPNTATRQDSRTTNQPIEAADDPYYQNNQSTDTFKDPQAQTLNNGHFGPEEPIGLTGDSGHTASATKPTTPPRTLNKYMTRSAYDQLPQNGYSDQSGTTVNMDPTGATNYQANYQSNESAPNDKLTHSQNNQSAFAQPDPMNHYGASQEPMDYQYGTGGYANDDQYQNDFQDYGQNYTDPNYAGSDPTATMANADQGAATQPYGYYDQYADQANTARSAANYASTDYDTSSYATQPQGYDTDQTNEPSRYEDADADDYEDGRGRDQDLGFFQKIGILDWITAGLSLILILTNFIGGFISSGTFGSAGTTSSTLYKTMSLGGSTFKVTMILLLFLLMIGPLLLIVFSIWKIHPAYIIKLAAAVVSILAYIAVFGILISKGIVAASGLQNFQFGISAIIAIVLLIVNFILSVIEFVKY